MKCVNIAHSLRGEIIQYLRDDGHLTDVIICDICHVQNEIYDHGMFISNKGK
jgi:hypothetical protein